MDFKTSPVLAAKQTPLSHLLVSVLTLVSASREAEGGDQKCPETS